MNAKIIQIADDARTDPKIVRLVAPGYEPITPTFTYLVSDGAHDRYFTQVNGPNRNLSQFSPSPFASTTLSQMLALVENRGYTRDSLVSDLRFYEAEVLAKIGEDDRPQSPYDRPVTGTQWRTATGREVQRYLQLDTAEDQADEVARRIGELAQSGDAGVPVLVNNDILNHHILVAGATGSGKSHLLSNLSHIAAELGRAVVLSDHKPDHQDHHRPNPEARHPRGFTLKEPDPDPRGFTPDDTSAGPHVRYWKLDPADRSEHATQLSVKAINLDTEMLAATIFHRKGEETQAETFATIADAFAADRKARSETWTIHELVRYVAGTDPKVLESKVTGGNVKFNTGTVNAIKRRMLPASVRSRIPSFLDAEESKSGGYRPRPTAKAEIDRVFQPGLNVIRITTATAADTASSSRTCSTAVRPDARGSSRNPTPRNDCSTRRCRS